MGRSLLVKKVEMNYSKYIIIQSYHLWILQTVKLLSRVHGMEKQLFGLLLISKKYVNMLKENMLFVFTIIKSIIISLVGHKIKLLIYGIDLQGPKLKEQKMLMVILSDKLQILMDQEWLLLALMINLLKFGVEILNLSKLYQGILLLSFLLKLLDLVFMLQEVKIKH